MWIRWLRFNAVGVAGAGVQLAALSLLTRFAGLNDLIATILAVEIAVLHNFVWHEAWTWRGLPVVDRKSRLLRFHIANGLVSIVCNALFTWLLKEWIGLPLLAANLGAIGATALINFALAQSSVFQIGRLTTSERP